MSGGYIDESCPVKKFAVCRCEFSTLLFHAMELAGVPPPWGLGRAVPILWLFLFGPGALAGAARRVSHLGVMRKYNGAMRSVRGAALWLSA
jgi:hypothetical protein